MPAAAARIRWDRVGRVAMLVVLVVLLWLYAGPARSYVSALGEAEQRRAEVAELKRENRALRERRVLLRSDSAIEAEARRLGLVRPRERSFVVRGLPAD